MPRGGNAYSFLMLSGDAATRSLLMQLPPKVKVQVVLNILGPKPAELFPHVKLGQDEWGDINIYADPDGPGIPLMDLKALALGDRYVGGPLDRMAML